MQKRLTRLIALLMVFVLTGSALTAQKLAVSDPDKQDVRQTNFEIIGKYGDNVLVYKNNRYGNNISVYDTEMKMINKVDMPYMPEKIIEATFVTYPDHSYLFYQHFQKGVVYAKVVLIDEKGNNMTQPMEIDTTFVGGANDKIYSVLPSEDKKHIAVFKINTRSNKRYLFKTLLYNDSLRLVHSTQQLALDVRDRNDFLTDFSIDNAGNIVFGKGIRNNDNDNISKFQLIVKPAREDVFRIHELALQKITLDEVKLKVDNFNNRYLLTGFYYSQRKRNIEGIANAIFDRESKSWVTQNTVPLGEELRQDARGENNMKSALDDYFIHDITIRNDGAFLVNAESVYTTSRGNSFNNFNRWNYFYNPTFSVYDYYRWGRFGPYGNAWNQFGSVVRYHAENILALAFDKNGKLLLSNVVRKTQFDDNSDAMVSYAMINAGNGLHYLYNDFDKRDIILAYQTLSPQGKIIRNPTMKGLERDFTFLPRYARQVGSKTVVLPTMYRNTLGFARVDF